MVLTSRYLLVLLSLSLFSSCQKVVKESFNPITFRIEVAEGTEGAIACDYLTTAEGIVWFGPGHTFNLDNVEVVMGISSKSSGGEVLERSENVPMVTYQIKKSEAQAFQDFTAINVRQRMAIEINGRIVYAGLLDTELPGGGPIPCEEGSYSLSEAEDVVASLRKSNS